MSIEAISKSNLSPAPKMPAYALEDQLDLDLGACPKKETGFIDSPSRQKAIETDFGYALQSLVEHISQDVEAQKETLLSMNQSRKQALIHELSSILSELNDFKPTKPFNQNALEQCMYASLDSLLGRTMGILCARVTYFTTIRLLLIHYWKNLGLLSDSDRNLYQEPNLTINSFINKHCANLIAQKHNWLFARLNNYSWYKMSSKTLDEVEHILCYWTLNHESVLSLSDLYEKYLHETRLKKHAHYTSPLLAKFMLDFTLIHSPDKSLMRLRGTHRVPKLVFDPACGTGNFLLEAAWRMKTELFCENPTPKTVQDYSHALTTGLFGCDMNVFSHYFTEVKLLWKLSSALAQAQELKLLSHQKPDLSISVIHQNAFKLFSDDQLDMVRATGGVSLSTDTAFGLLPLEGHLKKIHHRIKLLEKFDFCFSAPPEQIVNDQKSFFKEVIQAMPYWKKYHETNLLYSSWFFVLGLSKLREGGKLAFLTETYWPTEEGASLLRKYILQNSKVLSIVDLGDTHPRYITLLEKCTHKEFRDVNKIKIVKVHFQNDTPKEEYIFGKLLQKVELIDRPGKIFSDETLEIYFSGVNQGELNENPWQQICDTGFSKILKQIVSFKTTLNYFCEIQENTPFSENENVLMTPETSLTNHFKIFEKRNKPGNYLTLHPKPICKESPLYILAILNSPVINFWYGNHSTKKNGKRYFEPSTLKMIPIRPINFEKRMEASIREEKINQIKVAIEKSDFKYLMANLNLELKHGSEELLHDAIVMMQERIHTLTKKLKRYDSLFLEKFSTQKNADMEPKFNPISFKEIYPPDKQCALKDHRKVFIQKDEDLILEKFSLAQFKREKGLKNEGEHLILISQDNKMIRLYSEKFVLDFIEKDLHSQIHGFWDEIEASILLPEDLEDFEGFRKDIMTYCMNIKYKQIELIQITNELIFKLYGFDIDDKDPIKVSDAQEVIQIMEATC
ncbi:MAG: hypothetical protein A3B70_05300 [Deltaproteobacteria bacterium RIFCSPHIGHO2_02_FULL_40_11]|nr:MAG: hypothetical protein A3B70_05300 [Deltaproteobacteria bacterium RIFCSPHIGHO2_02_FULL_40_11]